MCDFCFETNTAVIMIRVDGRGIGGRKREGERWMENDKTFVRFSEWSECRNNLRKGKNIQGEEERKEEEKKPRHKHSLR